MADPPTLHGLVIGRFDPLTAAHLRLIEAARSHSARLSVLVCSQPDDAVDGHRRWGWVRESVPDLDVRHLLRAPRTEWARLTPQAAPEARTLFTAHPARAGWATGAGLRLIALKPEPGVATARVRADPLRYWARLAPPARAHYAIRVLVYGPESTGKSTLARQLAQHYQTEVVPEFARDYLAARGDVVRPEDFGPIALGQMEVEEALARRANRLLFCDTDLITTTVYARHFLGHCPPFIQRLADERRYDLVLFTDIDLPWVADPLRDSPHQRQAHREAFMAELHSRGIPFITIRGQGPARLQAAVQAVEACLRTSPKSNAQAANP